MLWLGLVSLVYGVGSGIFLLRLAPFVLGMAAVAAGHALLVLSRGDGIGAALLGALVVLVTVQIGYGLGLGARTIAVRRAGVRTQDAAPPPRPIRGEPRPGRREGTR